MCTKSPEECPELFFMLNQTIKARLNNLVNISIQFCVIGQNVQLSVGEGDNRKTTSGLPVVADLIVDSIMGLILKVVLQSSENLALSRDIIKSLNLVTSHEDSKVPSLSEKVINLLSAIERMEEQFVISQQPSQKPPTQDKDN